MPDSRVIPLHLRTTQALATLRAVYKVDNCEISTDEKGNLFFCVDDQEYPLDPGLPGIEKLQLSLRLPEENRQDGC